MRIFALLNLVIATVFVLTPSINNGLWSWFLSASAFTKTLSALLVFSIGGILVRCTWDIRAQEIQKRTWRNVAFVASTLAAGLIMVAMLLVATLTPVPDWMLSIVFVALLTAVTAYACAHLSTRHDSAAG